MRVLQLAPETYLSVPFLGSTKDIASRVQYYEDRAIDHEILVHRRRVEEVLDAISSMSDRDFTHVVVEKGNSRPVLKLLRGRLPDAKILIRAHNAEFPHRCDYVRATMAVPNLRSPGHIWKQLKGVWFFGSRDLAAAYYADTILAISDWDAEHYWNRLVGGSRVSTVPFFLPRSHIAKAKRARRKKPSLLCVLPGSTGPGPLIEHALSESLRFLRSQEADELRRAGWKFVISGKKPKKPAVTPLAAAFTEIGVGWRLYESPYDILNRARAVMVLSDYGRGFKTKLLEAILCKAYVLCTEGLYRRLPRVVQPYCIVVDADHPETISNALNRTLEGFPEGNPNAKLHKAAYRELDRLFGLA